MSINTLAARVVTLLPFTPSRASQVANSITASKTPCATAAADYTSVLTLRPEPRLRRFILVTFTPT